LARKWPGHGNIVQPLLGGGLSYVLQRWHPDPVKYLEEEFRVPTWHGLASSPFRWELPEDPIVASLILDYYTAIQRVPIPEVWMQLTKAIDGALRAERHGHWLDFLLKNEGAMPSNTALFNSALLSYLSHWRWRLQAWV
jgi:hypothetical protein